MRDEMESRLMMEYSNELELHRIMTQALADVAVEILKKEDYVGEDTAERVADKARILVYRLFGGNVPETYYRRKGGAE